MQKQLSNNHGFVLVGLLAAMVIIGILLSVFMTNLSGKADDGIDGKQVKESSRMEACRANINVLTAAVSVYYADNGDYPASLAELIPDFIQKLPECPFDQKSYQYDPVTGQITDHDHQ